MLHLRGGPPQALHKTPTSLYNRNTALAGEGRWRRQRKEASITGKMSPENSLALNKEGPATRKNWSSQPPRCGLHIQSLGSNNQHAPEKRLQSPCRSLNFEFANLVGELPRATEHREPSSLCTSPRASAGKNMSNLSGPTSAQVRQLHQRRRTSFSPPEAKTDNLEDWQH